MTREKFYKLIGEYPEDVLGADWKNEIDEYVDGDNEHFHDGHQVGGCFQCKMD